MAKRKKAKAVNPKKIIKAEPTKLKKMAKVERIKADEPPETFFRDFEKIRMDGCEKIRMDGCEKIRLVGCKKDGPPKTIEEVLAGFKERGRKKAARIKAKYEKLRASHRIAIAKRLKDKES